MKSFVGLIFVIFLVNGEDFWSSCPGSLAPGPDYIRSPHCSGDRCIGVRGEYVEADIYATPIADHKELRTRVTAFIFGIGILLPIEPPFDNACNDIYHNGVRVECPTIANKQYMIQVRMPISQFYPAFSNTRVRVEFFDGDVQAACGEVIADIV